jgi:hypothetical protein
MANSACSESFGSKASASTVDKLQVAPVATRMGWPREAQWQTGVAKRRRRPRRAA